VALKTFAPVASALVRRAELLDVVAAGAAHTAATVIALTALLDALFAHHVARCMLRFAGDDADAKKAGKKGKRFSHGLPRTS
jgi:hypothetical protein